MWPFKRQKTDKKVPPEVKQYYDSEHRERVGLAWVIAFMSLILTIAVVAGLFFGGRWIYRKIHNKGTTAQTTGQSTAEAPATAPNPNPSAPSKPNDLQPAAPSQNDNSSSSSNQANNTPSASTQPTKSKPTSQSKNITNTGAGSNIAIFLAVSTLATASHSIYQRRKLSKRA